MDALEKAFLGSGWAYPLEVGPGGEVAIAAYEDDVRESVRIVLGTGLGERVMRPDFGCNLRALLFEPYTTTTHALVEHTVRDALVRWEPRINVLSVEVSQPSPGEVDVEVGYRVRATNTFYNLVYPFFLLEGSLPR